MTDGKHTQEAPKTDVAPGPAPAAPTAPAPAAKGAEVGGPKGLEPTRYGDWERDGRCVDF